MSDSNLLVVDDDPATIRLLGHILSEFSQLRFATTGEDAVRLAAQSPPDLILLDTEMPGMDGFRVCEALKANPDLAHVPIIFVTSHSGPDFEIAGLELGAVDFISKPVSPALLIARVRTHLRLKQMSDELRYHATVDGLTGLTNRRMFDEAIDREWLRTRRSGNPLSLLMVDVDHFKLYNDHYGHQAGDECLRSVAQALQRVAHRPADHVCRYGGEEFALLLPETRGLGARMVARRLIGLMSTLMIPHQASPVARHVTVSIGISCIDDAPTASNRSAAETRMPGVAPYRAASDLVTAADQALYAAKLAGRARFACCAHAEPAWSAPPSRTAMTCTT